MCRYVVGGDLLPELVWFGCCEDFLPPTRHSLHFRSIADRTIFVFGVLREHVFQTLRLSPQNSGRFFRFAGRIIDNVARFSPRKRRRGRRHVIVVCSANGSLSISGNAPSS